MNVIGRFYIAYKPIEYHNLLLQRQCNINFFNYDTVNIINFFFLPHYLQNQTFLQLYQPKDSKPLKTCILEYTIYTCTCMPSYHVYQNVQLHINLCQENLISLDKWFSHQQHQLYSGLQKPPCTPYIHVHVQKTSNEYLINMYNY